MRIVYISRLAPPYYGGAGRATYIEAKYVQRAGWQTQILTSRLDKDTTTDEVMEGVAIHRFERPELRHHYGLIHFYTRCALWLLRHHRDVDVVYFATIPRFWMTLFPVIKLLRKPAFATITLFGADDLDTISKRRLGLLWLAMLRKISGIRSIGRSMIEVSQRFVPDDPIVYIPYAVDSDRFYPPQNLDEKNECRRKYDVPEASFVVVFSGAVIKRKGIDLLIECWPEVLAHVPEARLYVAGPRILGAGYSSDNDSFTAWLDSRIEELGIQDQIVFLGECADEVPELLRMADAYALPSRQEGLGQATLEAMATALPCLICEGEWYADDFIVHEDNGMICKLDPADIAAALNRIAGDSMFAARLGQRARATIEQFYHPDVVVRQLIDLYNVRK